MAAFMCGKQPESLLVEAGGKAFTSPSPCHARRQFPAVASLRRTVWNRSHRAWWATWALLALSGAGKVPAALQPLSVDNPASWEGAREFNAAHVSREVQVQRNSEPAIRVTYRTGAEKWHCGGIQRRFSPPIDLSTAGGYTLWVYNPDPVAKRIFSFDESGGASYWARHFRENPWSAYGLNDDCLLPAGPGWHRILFSFDALHLADRITPAPSRESLRSVARLVIAVQDRNGEERETWFAVSGLQVVPGGAREQPSAGRTRYPTDYPKGDPRALSIARLRQKIRTLRGKGDAAKAIAALEEALALNPWLEAVQAEALALYGTLDPGGKERLKALCRTRYRSSVQRDLALAQGWARLHQRLVDAWSQERPIQGYRLGTQTFGIRYQFTEKTKLVETAEAIRELGCDTIKFTLSPDSYDLPRGDYQNLADLARREPSIRLVLDMPFRHTLIWAYPLGVREWWRNGTGTPEERDAEYRQIYDLARYLLQAYEGTGRHFYLGNWEGDWHLTGIPPKEPSADRIAGMTEWFRVRQQAVDDAKRDTPHRNVNVFHYMEVNLVPEAIRGAPRLTNAVLPYTNVDYVSYSSYTTTSAHLCQSGRMPVELSRALDFIEQHLPPKDLPGKRVWIGEFGFPVNEGLTPALQERYTVDVARVGLQWGCPFVLYWEIYCNEYDTEKKQHRGFWLIDDRGEPQPVYYRFRHFLEKARAHEKAKGPVGLAASRYLPAALEWLK